MPQKAFKMTMAESMWQRIVARAEAQEKLPTEMIRDLLRCALEMEGEWDA